jgi:hypothetical protein
MRGLLWLVLAAAALWSGYWVVGSRTLEQGAETWFEDQAALGLVAERESLVVRGYPNRFDLTVNGLRLFDPATGYGWTAPFAQIFALSYRPNHVIAALPPEQVFRTPLQDITLLSDKLQASAVLDPGSTVGLNRLTVVGDGIGLESSLGWQAQARTVRFATKALSDDGLEHEIGFEALEVVPDPAFSALLPDMPAEVEKLRLDAIVGIAPADPLSPDAPPVVSGIDLKEALVTWGDVGLFGKGRIAANSDGLAEGRIDFRLTNWRKLLPLLVTTGAVSAEALPTWENALAMLAGQSGDPTVLELPLTMRAGRMSLGPLPLGPAPALR